MKRLLVAAGLALTLVGCQQPRGAGSRAAPAPRETDGLRIEELRTGDGPLLEPGKMAVVHYVGRLTNGKVFDSSRERGEPIEFVAGKGMVIQGWELGLRGMRVGGRRRLTVPPHLGYGENGAGTAIPPNATLVFEIELVDTR